MSETGDWNAAVFMSRLPWTLRRMCCWASPAAFVAKQVYFPESSNCAAVTFSIRPADSSCNIYKHLSSWIICQSTNFYVTWLKLNVRPSGGPVLCPLVVHLWSRWCLEVGCHWIYIPGWWVCGEPPSARQVQCCGWMEGLGKWRESSIKNNPQLSLLSVTSTAHLW